jgi:hypothetical protein
LLTGIVNHVPVWETLTEADGLRHVSALFARSLPMVERNEPPHAGVAARVPLKNRKRLSDGNPLPRFQGRLVSCP